MYRTSRFMLICSILTILIIALTACAAGGNNLSGTQWRLTELNGRVPLGAAEPIALNFTSTDQASGNSGCNSYSGSYRAAGSNLTFSALVSTERACLDQGMMTQEAALYQALSAVATYELRNDQLILMDSNGTVTLRFARI